MAFLAGENLVPGNSADVGLQPVGEIQSKRLRRPSAMTESSPNAAILDALIEIELRLDRVFEILDLYSDLLAGLDLKIGIVADREY